MDDDVSLREQVQAQHAVIERQGHVIERLEERLARVETTAPVSGPAEAPAADEEAVSREDTTDRRHLLTRAATLAAGTVVGGTALALGQASPAAAASGTFDGNPAVVGTANPTTGTGVRGNTVSGDGVVGTAGAGVAVHAYSDLGVQLRLEGTPPPPPTNFVSRPQGALIKDGYGDLWLCVVSGAPGTWRKLGGPATAGALHVLTTPVRVYDARPGFPPAIGTKAPLVGGVARTCDLKANGSGVPAGATAVLVNLVATGTTGASGGFLSVYRNGIAWPGTSSVNWSGPGQNVGVTTLNAVDANAICNLYANVATNVVVDVLGYYR